MSLISSLSSAFRGGVVPKIARAYITPLVDDVPSLPEAVSRAFQYFPETIQDTRGIHYEEKQIPGLSHPLYQWTSGGERGISFIAMFSRDRAITPDELSQIQQGAVVADLRNVDIPSAKAWLRSYTYPEYQADGQKGFLRPKPPRRLVLTLPGLRLSHGSSINHPDEIYAIMTQCDFEYIAFFSDGTPRMARAQLGFKEIIQYGNRINPVSAAPIRTAGLNGYKISVQR